MMTRFVKICGLTRTEDAQAAAEAGADYLGLNFVGGPRKITIEQARAIVEAVGAAQPCAKVRCVALTEAPVPEHLAVARIFQVYGAPAAGLLQHTLNVEAWLVAHVEEGRERESIEARRAEAAFPIAAVVVDKKVGQQLGGSGKTLDWGKLAEAWATLSVEQGAERPRLVLAGGLTTENVAEAVRVVRPWCVDVSSGVEVAGQPGVKDHAKMRDFIQAAKGV
jgi:phosphoribosylanthranilate isomerase